MINLREIMNRLVGILHSRTTRMILMVAALALFILAAGAPNATIGIGK